jgi:hypothetical protein
LIVIVSAWTRRHLGLASALLVVAAMALHPRLIEGFYPSYVDHHGLLATSVLGTLLGAAAMMRGQRAGAVFSRPVGRARRVGERSLGPSGDLPVRGGSLPRAPARGSGARPGDCGVRSVRRASLAFYAVEYFPQYMALRLEVNHPLAFGGVARRGRACRAAR